MGTIIMSARERRRMVLVTRVTEGLLKLREAAQMMRLSYRQTRRVLSRYREAGDQGLVHRGRGKTSNRARQPLERQRIVELYNKHYKGFWPLLASEHLESDHGIKVDHETLRRWLMAEGLWSPRQHRPSHREARERRPRRGDLVQIDGSEHDWFEGRGPRPVLMVMIDDATNETLARFHPSEDTAGAYDIFERYVRQYGLPAALYPDRDSIYICTREANLDEQLAGQGPETQFARAMRELGVELFPAYSPQAKGRVERRHGLFQDRLVKEMRLRQIRTIEAANAYLESTFLPFINQRYTCAPRDPVNGHRARPPDSKLAMALSWQEGRTVAKDWTVRWRNCHIQIDARHAALGLPGKRVQIVELRDGSVVIRYGNRILTTRPAPVSALKPPPPPNTWPHQHIPPPANHPWRRSAIPLHRRLHHPPPTSNKAHSRGTEEAAISISHTKLNNQKKGTFLMSSKRGHF